MKKYSFAVFCLLVLIGSFFYITQIYESEVESELNKIEINKIQFFMTRDAVENMYGLGLDETPGCFGCEMNFIYPVLQLSGRYSETLGQDIENGKSPKVKQITSIDKTVKVFDIGVGDTFEKAARTLELKGFSLQENSDDYFYNYFFNDNVYIRLWKEGELYPLKRDNNYLGKDHEIINGITIEFRVKQDEEINY